MFVSGLQKCYDVVQINSGELPLDWYKTDVHSPLKVFQGMLKAKSSVEETLYSVVRGECRFIEILVPISTLQYP